MNSMTAFVRPCSISLGVLDLGVAGATCSAGPSPCMVSSRFGSFRLLLVSSHSCLACPFPHRIYLALWFLFYLSLPSKWCLVSRISAMLLFSSHRGSPPSFPPDVVSSRYVYIR